MRESGEPSHAESIVARYPVGSEPPVYFDPSEPSRSVLETGLHGVPWFFLLLGFPILVFGLVMGVYLPRRLRPRAASKEPRQEARRAPAVAEGED